MALIKCPECGKQVSDTAITCPDCGKKISNGHTKKQNNILIFALLFFALCCVIAIVGIMSSGRGRTSMPISDSNPQVVGTVETQQVVEEKQTEFSVGEVVEVSDFRITCLSANETKSKYSFVEPKEGYVTYEFTFEFENITNVDQLVSSWDFACYADGYNMEQNYYMDTESLDATISPGRKVKGSICYDVPKDAKELVVEYETSYWTQNKVVFKVK